ncbi:MAG: hypothetical protein DU429_03510 [Candidatus Tokpelaia sp.]|nr:MAG: hypothetical protein DU430_01375 [Candidatus Tokpelaia sp.]KAA6207176.1 MAG: hypothetical protein DU429_03510 [Candidatus Tokpelaia sp.]
MLPLPIAAAPAGSSPHTAPTGLNKAQYNKDNGKKADTGSAPRLPQSRQLHLQAGRSDYRPAQLTA